ncbi:MAG: molybdenum cofactor guanylyltransferase [Calditrichaeota bacterium]|nr:molybdenum cofactor guanylyltransferase [Calditrichota bacterium]
MTIAIIAGGKSSRFGDSKLKALYLKRRLIDYAVDLAYSLSPHVMIVGGTTSLPEDLRPPVVHDLTTEIGPLGGIVTALTFGKTDWLAVMPCDAPQLSAKIYQALFDHVDRDVPVVAISKSGMEPLVSLWPRSVLPILKQTIAGCNYALRPLLRRLNATMCDVTKIAGYSENWFVNINCQHDLQLLEAAISSVTCQK